MPIDPRIAMGYQAPQIESPLNMFAKYQQIQSAQQQNELARMQVQEYERGLQEQEGLRNYLAGKPDLSSPEGLLRFGKTGAGMAKTLSELAKERLASEKTRTETEAAQFKLQQDKLAHGIQSVGSAKSATDVIAALDEGVQQGYFTKQQADAQKSELASLQTMPEFQAWQQKKLQGLISAKDQLTMTAPKPQEVKRADGSIIFLDANPNSPTFKQEVMPSQAAGVTPAEAQRLAYEGQRVSLESRRVGLAEQQQAQRTDLSITPKEIQKREAVFPQATSSIKAFDAKTDSFIKDLEQLRNHPGLNQITGLVAGRIPAVTSEGRAAQALYDKVVAKGGFQALQDLRDASKTGGALGNVSNQEGKQLTASFAAIDRKQDASNVKEAIDRAIGDIQGSKARMKEAYDMTYGYKNLPADQGEVPLPSVGGARPSRPGPSSPLPPKTSGGVIDFGSLK
jgi:hypothetical protein